MSGIKIGVDVRQQEWNDVYQQIARLVINYRFSVYNSLRKIAAVLLHFIHSRFDLEADLNGKHWTPLRPATIRKKGHDQILYQSGKLIDSISAHIDEAERKISLVTDCNYATTQQFGMKRGAYGVARNGAPIPWGNVPPRPFMGLSVTAVEEARVALHNEILKAMKRKMR